MSHTGSLVNTWVQADAGHLWILIGLAIVFLVVIVIIEVRGRF